MSADQSLEKQTKPLSDTASTPSGLQPEDYQLIKTFAKTAKDLSLGDLNNIAIVDSQTYSTKAIVGDEVRVSKDQAQGTTTISAGSDGEGLLLKVSPTQETWSAWGKDRNAVVHFELDGNTRSEYVQINEQGQIYNSQENGNFTWHRWDGSGNQDWGYSVDGKDGMQKIDGTGFYKDKSAGQFFGWNENGAHQVALKIEEGLRTLKMTLGQNTVNITEWGDGTVKVEQSDGSGWVSKPAGVDMRSYHTWGKKRSDNRDFVGKSIGFQSMRWAESASANPQQDPTISSFIDLDALK